METIMINDFNDTRFQEAFKQYFQEFEIDVSDWDSLFNGMNKEDKNLCYMIIDKDETLGFIQFCLEKTEHCFLKQEFGFVRELWVKETHRNNKYGKKLLNLVETYVFDKGIFEIILTSEANNNFYLQNGYVINKSYKPKNKDTVYTKILHDCQR